MTYTQYMLSSIALGLMLSSSNSFAQVAQAKIANGNNTSISQAPWQVALAIGTLRNDGSVSEYSRFCSGTLISNRWIVSAAHCISDQTLASNQRYFAIVGQQDLGNAVQQSAFHPISSLVKRSDYDANNFNNDIVLSKLTNPINLNNCNGCNVAKWSNNDTDSSVNKAVFVAGWGATATAQNSNTLQSTTLNIVQCVSNDTGQPYTVNKNNLSNNTLCAQSNSTPRSDTCLGDSGSGLIANYGTPQATLVGITSFSIQGNNPNAFCNNDPNYPGAYTKVANYCQWIQEITGINNSCVVSNQNSVNNSQIVNVSQNSATTSSTTASNGGGGGALGGLSNILLGLSALGYSLWRRKNLKNQVN